MAKSFRERLMNLRGLYWWPPNHNDPRIKGPQPRIITRKQYETLMNMRNSDGLETERKEART